MPYWSGSGLQGTVGPQPRRLRVTTSMPHHRVLYHIVIKKKPILSGDLRNLYRKECREMKMPPIAARTFSDYCNKLVAMNLVDAKRAPIQGKVREFSVPV